VVACANAGPDTNKAQVRDRFVIKHSCKRAVILSQGSSFRMARILIRQFFISYAKQPSLDGKYTIFGRYVWHSQCC
jgi:cyclophilin family peptidyl-prolyl cis-trans isomerase